MLQECHKELVRIIDIILSLGALARLGPLLTPFFRISYLLDYSGVRHLKSSQFLNFLLELHSEFIGVHTDAMRYFNGTSRGVRRASCWIFILQEITGYSVEHFITAAQEVLILDIAHVKLLILSVTI